MARPITVSELASYIQATLSTDPILKRISVIGEVANVRFGRMGFFDLIDRDALISCICFEPPQALFSSGDRVIVTGRLTTYKSGSRYQVVVTAVELSGVGDKLEALERLKHKLHAEGLFDASRKRELPGLPNALGLITSAEGAVLHDFANEINRRYPIARIILHPSPVQGGEAAESIRQGLLALDGKVDVIIIARGGGGSEHLSVFNDEALVRAIAETRTPVITAIGHQVDTTLADLAADRRASTPTEAAILVCPDMHRLNRSIDAACLSAATALRTGLNQWRHRVDRLLLEQHRQLESRRRALEWTLRDQADQPVVEASLSVGAHYYLCRSNDRYRIVVESKEATDE